ncbi:MFS transporter [Lactobacillus crispatus]
MLGTIAMIALLFAILGGYISDKYSKIKLMRFLILIRFIFIALGTIFLVFKPKMGVAVVCFVVIASSVINIIYNPLTEAFAPALIDNDKELIEANSWVSLANNIATIISSGLATIFVTINRPLISLVILLVAVIISYILLGFIKPDTAPVHADKIKVKEIFDNFIGGMKLVEHNKLIMLMIPIALVVNFCFYVIWLLTPKFAITVFSQYWFVYNGIDIAYTVGGIIGALIFSKIRDNINSAIICPACLSLQALCLAVVGISSLLTRSLVSATICIVCWLAYGIFNSIFSIVYFSVVQMSSSKDNTGLMIGAVMTIFSVINPIATAMSDPLGNMIQLPLLIFILGVVMVLVSVMTFMPIYQRIFKKYDKLYSK